MKGSRGLEKNVQETMDKFLILGGESIEKTWNITEKSEVKKKQEKQKCEDTKDHDRGVSGGPRIAG